MKRLTRIIIAAVCALMVLSCHRDGDFSILKYRLDHITPTGLRSAACTFEVNVCNKGPQIDIDSGNGTLFADERVIGTFKIDPVTIAGHETAWVHLRCLINIDDGISLLEVLQIFRQNDLSAFKISYEASVKTGFFKKTLKEDKLPLSEFVK